jgi:hypothetical protein
MIYLWEWIQWGKYMAGYDPAGLSCFLEDTMTKEEKESYEGPELLRDILERTLADPSRSEQQKPEKPKPSTRKGK